MIYLEEAAYVLVTFHHTFAKINRDIYQYFEIANKFNFLSLILISNYFSLKVNFLSVHMLKNVLSQLKLSRSAGIFLVRH